MTLPSTSTPVDTTETTPPPYARAIQVGAGLCLVLAGLLNGLTQYLTELLTPDMEFSEQIAWGATHELAHRTEQTLLVVSALFLPLGLLGLAQATRWSAPRLTLWAVPLMLWGMWGFHNVLAMGYVAGTVSPTVLPVSDAVELNDALPGDVGVVITALVPHLAGSFFGILLLAIAAWRCGLFSRIACALVIVFLVWDFLLPAYGPLEPHLLLAVGFTWLGVSIVRLPASRWRGARTS
jgi:hypothetical protein